MSSSSNNNNIILLSHYQQQFFRKRKACLIYNFFFLEPEVLLWTPCICAAFKRFNYWQIWKAFNVKQRSHDRSEFTAFLLYWNLFVCTVFNHLFVCNFKRHFLVWVILFLGACLPLLDTDSCPERQEMQERERER